jgi:hypothetical protein
LFETQEACRNRGFAHLVSKWDSVGSFSPQYANRRLF